MKLDSDGIRAAIIDGRLKAITVDTSVVDGLQRALEHGPLKRLAQFRGGTTQLLLSDVVHNEIAAHLVKEAKDAAASLDKALRHVGTVLRVSTSRLDELRRAAIGEQSPDEVARCRLADWMTATGAQLVRAHDLASIDELLGRYFERSPPFANGAKKNEFPDALALLSLEAWAERNGTLVLAVSKDGDWAAYCEQSSRVVVLDDLAEALACFQSDEARYACRVVAERTRANDAIGLLDAIEAHLREQDGDIDLSAEAHSPFNWFDEMIEAVYNVTGMGGVGDDAGIEPLSYGDGQLVASLLVDVEARFTGHFSFEKWESIDREHLPMGTGSASTQEQLAIYVEVTFGGKLPEHPEIEGVEVQRQHVSVDFGEIEPSWMRDGPGLER